MVINGEYSAITAATQEKDVDVFYAHLVRDPTAPALGPPSKLHAEVLLPAAAAFEPSVHRRLKVRPAAPSCITFFPSPSLWLFFSCKHILHLRVGRHDSTYDICRPSRRPSCAHASDRVFMLRGAMLAEAA